MSKEKIIQRAGWVVVALVTIVVVAVFATIKNDSTNSVSVSDSDTHPVSLNDSKTHPASLKSIIDSRQTWDVAFPSWSGKAASDFTVKDIHGQSHKLSDYHGKNLLVVFWATWCPACNAEIPHLIELRKMYSEDELTILAISNESVEELKQFADDKGINYMVAVLGSALPEPFSRVTSIPTTFFIGWDGTIKVAALGVVPVKQAKAIVEAETDHK
jgi:peroxiredoxin